MQKTEVYVKRLTDDQKNELAERLLPIEYPEAGYGRYLERIREVAADLGDMFDDVRACSDLSRSGPHHPGAVKITNLPTSARAPMPPARSRGVKRIEKDDYLSENLLVLVSSFFGDVYSVACEGRGLVNNVIPSQQPSEQPAALGHATDLRYHIENVALRSLTGRDCCPKALVFTGVHQDVTPPYTRISDARLALPLLSEADLAQLRSPAYRFRLPYLWRSHRPEYETMTTEAIPLIAPSSDGLLMQSSFYGNIIAGAGSSAAERAARNLEAAIEAVGIDEVVAPGEILAIDNRVTLHARTPFEATFDEQGRAHRWIQRTFVAQDIANFDGWERCDDHVFAPTFTAGLTRAA